MTPPTTETPRHPVQMRAALVKLYKMAGATFTYGVQASVLYDDQQRDLAVLRWYDINGKLNLITAVTEHEASLLLASAFGWQGDGDRDHQTPWRRFSTTVMAIALVVNTDDVPSVLSRHEGIEAKQLIGVVHELLDAVRLEFGEPMSPTKQEQAP